VINYDAPARRFLGLLRALLDPAGGNQHERGKKFAAAAEASHADSEVKAAALCMEVLIREYAAELDEPPEQALERIEAHLLAEEKDLDELAVAMEHWDDDEGAAEGDE
jgi:hypothetical protein